MQTSDGRAEEAGGRQEAGSRQGRQLEQAMAYGPRQCGPVSTGRVMRFAERILGCRLGGYMCREFVGTACGAKTKQLAGVAIIEQHNERPEVDKQAQI